MKRTSLLLAVALSLLFTALAYSALSAQYIPRHTPGFPQVINESVLRDILESILSNSTMYRQLQQVLSTVNATSLTGTYLGNESAAKPNLIENPSQPSYPAIPELMSGNLSSILQTLAQYRGSSAGFLELLEKLAQYLQHRGGVSSTTYIDILNAVRSSAYRVGGAELYIKALKYLLNYVPSNVELPPLPNTSMPVIASSSSGASLPSPPPLSAPSPASLTMLSKVFIPAVCAIAIAVALYLIARSGALTRLRLVIASRAAPKTVAQELARMRSEIVELYWRAVNAVSRATGMRIGKTETHREYLERVRKLLSSSSQAFEELTMVYEIHRFGHVISSSLVERARRAFDRLVRSS